MHKKTKLKLTEFVQNWLWQDMMSVRLTELLSFTGTVNGIHYLTLAYSNEIPMDGSLSWDDPINYVPDTGEGKANASVATT